MSTLKRSTLHHPRRAAPIFITTSRFTPEATTYADRVAARVVLIDGAALSALMVRHNIGVQDQQTYVINALTKISSTRTESGSRMRTVWPLSGRTRTLNVAIYCASVSIISARQHGNGQVADGRDTVYGSECRG